MPPSRAHLETLNPDQRRAAEYGVAQAGCRPGPLLIIAGAGSGKTNTLAHRVAHLAAHGADLHRILLLTFSRRAASEMARRVERILGLAFGSAAPPPGALAWAGTFHAVGARLIREHAEQIGLDPAFTIHDREDAADLMNLARHELGFSRTESRFPTKATCLAIYSRAVNGQAALGEVLGRAFPWCAAWEAQLRQLFAAYVEAKQRHNVLDYDDLLLYWAQMMAEPALAGAVAERFDHVLVDEYQDTNRLQAAILLALKPRGDGLTVVGDDAQSIYSFRAATVRNILDFPAAFTPPAAVVTLERNYRSTEPILAASNAVISLAAERFTKNLWSDRAARSAPAWSRCATRPSRPATRSPGSWTIARPACRSRARRCCFAPSRPPPPHHSGPLEIELSRRNIPYVKFGGLKFLEAAHVKDLLAFLRFAENPRDRIAGFRVLQLLPGIGPAAAARVLERIATADPVSALVEFGPPPRAAEAWPAFAAVVLQLSGRGAGWPAELAAVRAWYDPQLERIHGDAAMRIADLAQLEQIASGYPSRERFLTELTLDPPDATSGEAGPPHRDEDYLILSTIHSAKGQEWRAVLVLNAVDGCIPSDMGTGSREEIEEERRLLYVAMTRARDQLDLILPQRFHASQQARNGDRHVYAARTRFIPASLLAQFEQRVWPAPLAAESAGSSSARPQPRVDIGARLRTMWR